MMTDLRGEAKPCPLCGSDFIVSETTELGDFAYSISIQCAGCGLQRYKSFTRKVSETDGFVRVLDYWNTRTPAKEID